MTASQNNNLSKDLAKSLESATSLMHDLLYDIKDNATSLVMLKVKLESLSDNVESLSHIVRDSNGKGSMVIRMALIEQSLTHIEESFDELKNEISEVVKEIKLEIYNESQVEKEYLNKEKEFKREKLLTKLKVFAVVAPGVIALTIVIIKMIMAGI